MPMGLPPTGWVLCSLLELVLKVQEPGHGTTGTTCPTAQCGEAQGGQTPPAAQRVSPSGKEH